MATVQVASEVRQDALAGPGTGPKRRGRPKGHRIPGKGEDKGPVTVYGYCRVSTGGQEKHGYGLPAQQQAIREYVESKGWTLIRIFTDTISGAAANEDDLTLPRPGFEEMLSHVNGVQFVVVLHTSRLWRSDLARILVTRALKKAGMDIRSVEQPKFSLYASEPGDVFVNGVMGLLDQYERLVIATRTRRGRLQKAGRGGYAGGKAPFGYRSERGSKVLRINPDEVKIVKKVFMLHRRLSPYRIAEVLNAEGLRTRDGHPWRHIQIYRILTRKRFYEGKHYVYGGIEGPAQHEAIL